MENYFRRLLLTSELHDAFTFAQVHQEIADLERELVEHFNEHGPMNPHYIYLLAELNGAYARAQNTERGLEVAQQIYQSSQILHGEKSELTIEALMGLGFSYLDDNQVGEAQSIATMLLRMPWGGDEGPSFDLYIDALALQADIKHHHGEYDDELILRKHILAMLTELSGATSGLTILARAAIGFCLEQMGNYQEALDHYLIVRSYLDYDSAFASEAEKIGLMVHIGRCYQKLGETEHSRVIYRWAHRQANRHYGKVSPLSKKTAAILRHFEQSYQGTEQPSHH